MSDASSLHCPNCGAAAEPDAVRCAYCRARLATISCPSCFALMFEGAAYCPRCGAAAERREPADEAAVPGCPACGGSMVAVAVGATALRQCAACDGVWIDAAAFERLCAEQEVQAAVLHHFVPREPPRSAGPVRYRPCLRCGKLMNRVNFGRLSGAVIDVCRGHGTFLDPGELHQIATFVREGGLDRMRRREVDDLREERRRLADAEARLARTRNAQAETSRAGRWSASEVLRLLDFVSGD